MIPSGAPGRLLRAGAARAVVVALVLAAPDVASAEPSPEEHALADARFQEGRALMSQQRVDEACAKFEESERLFPRGGTALNLAACREREGRIASAWAAATLALGLAQKEGRSDREQVAKAKIAELEGQLSWLVIQVSPALEAAGVAITRDGLAVGRGAWSVAVPVDPGRHVVVARVPDAPPIEVAVDVGARGDRRVVTLPPQAGAPPASAPSAELSASRVAPPKPELGAVGVIRLHIESPRPVRLVGGMDSAEARGMNLPICTSPCDAVIDGRYWQSLRFEGDGFPDSGSFFAGDRKGHVVARVSPGSSASVTLGTLLFIVGAGGAGVATALFVAAPHDPVHRGGLEAAGAAVLVTSGAALVAGVILRLNGRTTFKLTDGPAAPRAARAPGLGFAF